MGESMGTGGRKGRGLRVLMVTQAVDLDHPILGFTHAWVNALARRVEELHVVTLEAGRHRLADNVILHAYGPPAAPHSRLGRFWFYDRCFAQLILGGRIDVVFVHMIPRWVILAAPYARLRQASVVLWYAHGAVSRQLRLAHRLADRVVTSSPESYPLQDEDKAVVLGQGIDTTYFRPAVRQPDGTFRVLSVGRLSPVKQHELLIEAARILVQERGMDDLQVRIVGGPARHGDRAYAQRLHQLISFYNLEAHTALAGPLPYGQVAQEYQTCDLFVNFSRTGSLDKTALEAMACGVPVITSNPAFRSLFPMELRSLLLRPDFDVCLLVQLVEHLSGLSPDERRGIGLRLRQEVETNHALEHMVEKMVSVFRICVDEEKRGGNPS